MASKIDKRHYLDMASGSGQQLQTRCLLCDGSIEQVTDQVWYGLGFMDINDVTSLPHYLCLVFGTCSVCGVRVQSPRMLDSSLTDYYSTGLYRQLLPIERRTEDRTLAESWRYDIALELIDTADPVSLTHMDFGGDLAGMGVLLVEKRDFSSINIELSTEARSYAEKVNKIPSFAELPDEKTKFGVITALEVVEHVPNPVQLVADLYNRLEDGGLLIMSMPVATEAMFGQFSLPHIHVFSDNSIRVLLEKAGVTETYATHHEHGAAFISVTRRST